MSTIETPTTGAGLGPAGDGPATAEELKARTRRAAQALQSSATDLRDAAMRYADTARGQLQTTQQRAIDTARERPATTALTAFGLGLAVGFALAACTTETRARWMESANDASRRMTARFRAQGAGDDEVWS